MKRDIINTYEAYREEDRLTTNQARRIEFLTTTRALEEQLQHLHGKGKILDCAAGTGVYAFYLADQGYEVTATDLTPRHVEVMRQQLEHKKYHMDIRTLDAVDMSVFADEL